MKILLLQYTKRQKEQKENFLRIFDKLGLKDIELDTFSVLDEAPDKELLKKYDRFIFGGSEFSFEGINESEDVKQKARELALRSKDFVHALVSSSVPSLAICFGHQVFAFSFGAKVGHDSCRFKAGAFKVEILPSASSDPIFDGLPQSFLAAYMHQDTAFDAPGEAQVLANGERCNFAVLKYGKNSYTTQFHPEFDKETLLKNYKRIPHYFKRQEFWTEDLIKDTPEANKILKNFVLNF